MTEKIEAYIVGRVKFGSPLSKKDPAAQAEHLLKAFKEINEINIITGEWDLMIQFEVTSMEKYYHIAWGIARHLERGWGTLVAKKITR